MRSSLRRSLQIVLIGAAVLAGWLARRSFEAETPPSIGVTSAAAAVPTPTLTQVVALGRLQPKDGVIRVAGPSQTSPVVAELRVDTGDHVEAGQTIAVLDSYALLVAANERLLVDLEHVTSEFERREKLFRDKLVSVSERDEWREKLDGVKADLSRGKIEIDHSIVRAPISGQVLEVHARPGERIGADCIVEIAKTDQMYAIAEVYETEIGHVHVGQRATVSSPALRAPIQGTVERIGMKIGKLDTVDADPIAKTDARVVAVEIRLDDSAAVASLTNLQVEVMIRLE